MEELRKCLQNCSCIKNIVIFDTISANPKLSEVRKGILLGKQERTDVIVGFGGGSAMDAAKAIAAGVKSEVRIEDLFYQGGEPGADTLPVIAIPTTAGTGSELSKAAIITDDVRKIKSGIRGRALYCCNCGFIFYGIGTFSGNHGNGL